MDLTIIGFLFYSPSRVNDPVGSISPVPADVSFSMAYLNLLPKERGEREALFFLCRNFPAICLSSHVSGVVLTLTCPRGFWKMKLGLHRGGTMAEFCVGLTPVSEKGTRKECTNLTASCGRVIHASVCWTRLITVFLHRVLLPLRTIAILHA